MSFDFWEGMKWGVLAATFLYGIVILWRYMRAKGK